MDLYQVCEIPAEVLDSMSTLELAQAVVDHPMLFTVMLFDNYSEGLDFVEEHFNGLKELYARKDAASALLEVYNMTNSMPAAYAFSNETADVSQSITLAKIELLLAAPEIDQILATDESQADAFNNTPTPYAANTYTTVKTPKGSSVSVIKFGDDLTSQQKSDLDRRVLATYPKATKLSGSTRYYNCHSYAWYYASTSNRYWMNDPGKYMSDGSYKKYTYQNAGKGDKIYYPGEHTGIVTYRPFGPLDGNSVKVTSKWGQGPLMSHTASYSPYSTNFSTYTCWR